jgi:ABC-2 type transport system permease protein
MILEIARRELRSLFVTPLAWVALAAVQFVVAWMFLLQIDLFMELQPQLAGRDGAPGLTAIVVSPVLGTVSLVLMLASPVLTMRLVAEERRAGTLVLLLASPVSSTAIVLGKFLGAAGFLTLIVAVLALMPVSLLLGGTLDAGLLGAGLLGVVLMCTSFVAVGLFASTLTRQPAVAALATFGVLLMLWLLSLAGRSASPGENLIAWLSLMSHFEPLRNGLVDSRDVAFFLVFTGLFLALSVRRLDSLRLTG